MKIISSMKPLCLRLLSAIAMVTMLAACTTDEQYTRKYACSFTFYTGYHPTSILCGITANAGTFVWVTVGKSKGVNHVYVHRNDGGADEDWAMTTEIENNRLSYGNIGANNALIIGCTTAMEAKAYDRQCPYCLDNQSGVNYPLTWTDNGRFVECAKCGRKYDLNANGISSDGQRLLQYRVFVGAGYGGVEMLRVSN
jgi:hypothetical protein